MLFSSIPFLYYFLPCVILLYVCVPGKIKNIVLLCGSLLFYAWGGITYMILMLAAILIGYVFGIWIDNTTSSKTKKAVLILSVISSVGLLAYFKYTDFLIANVNTVTGWDIPLLKITLPIGISFYTFQIMSYVVDVYRGTAKAQYNPFTLATYISMFPQLIAGPIVRYADVAEQLEYREHSLDKAADGVRRFMIGLSKKILIANALGELCEVFKASSDKSVLFYWVYAVAFTLHIYYDFSGYSDMAIGLGKLFGFEFLENFNYPYISKSITEFWRRWHMSLGTWFRDYVYIPMGGNRVPKLRWFFNIITVWFLTGFWHGASWNFIVWGLYFAVFLILEKWILLPILKKTKVFSHIYVLFLVIISFVIFNATDMTEAVSYIKGMFGIGNIPLISKEAIYYVRSNLITICIAILGSTPLMITLYGRLKQNNIINKLMMLLEPFLWAGLLLLCTAYLVDGSFNPFLYFRF